MTQEEEDRVIGIYSKYKCHHYRDDLKHGINSVLDRLYSFIGLYHWEHWTDRMGSKADQMERDQIAFEANGKGV